MAYDIRDILGFEPYITSQWTYVPNEDGFYTWFGIGSCVANAIATIIEIYDYIKTGKQRRFSFLWLYGNRRATDDQNEGLYYAEVLNNLKSDGVPFYELVRNENRRYWNSQYVAPYNSSTYPTRLRHNKNAKQIVSEIRSSLLSQAQTRRIFNWFEINSYNVDLMKNWLEANKALLLPIDLTDAFYDLGYDGILPTGSSSDYVNPIGHTLVIIGWKKINGKHHWICQNSWGVDWGNNGICYVPWDCYHIYNTYVLIPGSYGNPPAPSNWTKWSSTIVKGQSFNIKAQDWNDFINHIAVCYNYCGYDLDYKNETYDGFILEPPWWYRRDYTGVRSDCYVKKGDEFLASNFNRVRYSIGRKSSTGITDIKRYKNPIKADDFYKLEDAVNRMIM